MRHSVLALSLTLLVSPSILSGATVNQFAVGNCKPNLPSFNNIQQAVTSVPSGATVLVCPGNYPEQVIITQPLNLQGLTIGDGNAAAITVPAGGMSVNGSDGFGAQVGAQLIVQNTGPVNISDLTIDGTGGSLTCADLLAGLFYQSSSGTIGHIVVRNQRNGGCGARGVYLENESTSSSPTVTLQNSSVHDFETFGILATPSTGAMNLVANILSNTVRGTGTSDFQIGIGGDGATISGNLLDNISTGILTGGLIPNVVSSNRVSNSGDGINLSSGGNTIRSNTIVNSVRYGIFATSGTGNVISANFLTHNQIAIDLTCGVSGNSVTGNTINEANVGIANTGNSGNSVAPNTTFSVTSIVGSCI